MTRSAPDTHSEMLPAVITDWGEAFSRLLLLSKTEIDAFRLEK
jgi:hypothetical protein